MSILQNNSINNLHSLYKCIGTNKAIANIGINDNFSFIQSYNSVWPNTIYNFKNNCIEDEKIVKEISDNIIAKKLPELALVYHDTTNTKLLKTNGFYTIEQWILMELNLERNIEFEVSNCQIVSTETELQSWLNVAQNVLFSNKRLDIKIFQHLMQSKAQLFCIKQKNEVVGTTLAYVDEHNVAGIYMVCINEQYRGKSLAKQLMKFTLNYLQKNNINKIVLQSTKAGLGLYTNLLFKETGITNLIYKIK